MGKLTVPGRSEKADKALRLQLMRDDLISELRIGCNCGLGEYYLARNLHLIGCPAGNELLLEMLGKN